MTRTAPCRHCGGQIAVRFFFGEQTSRRFLRSHEVRCSGAAEWEREYYQRTGKWPVRRRHALAR